MQSNGSRIVALLVAVAVVVALFFAFRGGDDDSTTATDAAASTAPTTTTGDGGGEDRDEAAKPDDLVPAIEVVGGEPKGGVTELEFEVGDEIRFDVSSDTADEVHVHGYDVEEELPAGGTAKFDFPADLDGVFEVELHHSGAQIAELTINP
jgi:hypothetical protein